MDPAGVTGQVRVAVMGDEANADMALPTKITIRELIPRIRTILAGGRDDDDIAAEFAAPTRKDRAAALQPWSLSPLAGTPFSLDATLESLGVSDGQQLMLCKLPPGPPAPPVVENIADAAAIHSAQQIKSFHAATMLGPAALTATLATATVICALALTSWHQGHILWAQVALGGLAALFIAGTAVTLRSGRPEMGGIAGVATLVPLGLALGAALPGPALAPRVFLAAAGLAAWSLLLVVITNRWVAAHTAVIATAVAVLMTVTPRILWHLPFRTLGCIILMISLVLASQAPMIAPVLARFPFSYVPAPGEERVPPLSLSQIEELPRRAAMAAAFQTGMIAASVLCTIAGSVLVVWLPDRPYWFCWYLVAAIGAVTVLRMRIFDAAVPSLWFLASPLGIAAALTASFAATRHLQAAAWAAGALLALVAVLVGAAAAKPGALSIPRRGYLDIVENILLVTLLPAFAVLTGLLTLLRNVGSL